ncbi:protein of unknown function [Pararobbsia alpina]
MFSIPADIRRRKRWLSLRQQGRAASDLFTAVTERSEPFKAFFTRFVGFFTDLTLKTNTAQRAS